MQTKMFEVRDRGTFIPVLAMRLEPVCEEERYLLARAGYGKTPDVQRKYVLLVKLVGGEPSATYDPFGWNTETMQEAHRYAEAHFDELLTGAVIDVEFMMGRSAAPKQSERLSAAGS